MSSKHRNITKRSKLTKRSYRMMEDEELVDIPDTRCKSGLFIQKLYDILRQGTNNNCFLEGAFVISDEDGSVFDSLTNTCFDNNGKSLNSMRYSAGSQITHDVFLNPDSFRYVHRGSRLDLAFLEKQKIAQLGTYYNSFSQFENNIRDINANITEYTFLCNPECNQNPNLEQCISTRRNVKRFILFYPFIVIKNAIRPEDEVKKRYVYLKLEDSNAMSVSHLFSSISAYSNPLSSDSSGFDYRRERLKSSDEQRYKTLLRQKDQAFYYELFTIGQNNQDIRFYNDYVRSNDEFFVPQDMTNRIFEMI